MAGKIVFYGRTYWDVVVRVPIASVTGAKSKMDAPVTMMLGGFANNAARAIAGSFRGEIDVVTVTSRAEHARIRAELPRSVGLIALPASKRDAPHPLTVVLDPAGACRIFRDPFEKKDAGDWNVTRPIAAGARTGLHVCGRLPIPFLKKLREATAAYGTPLGWVGGAALPRRLEQQCDLICVNRKEARELLGTSDDDARSLAEALAKRARLPFAVRVVTGREGGTAAAINEQGQVMSVVAMNAPTGSKKITRLLGVGDVFAATFIASAYYEKSVLQRRPAIERALDAAQRAAARFITS
jgi:sugar/nucleoside kinase (ribokinase family)